MPRYEDGALLLDEDGVTIKSYRRPGGAKHIPYSSIRKFEVFEMGFWTGRHRLVGISLGRPRDWFHWDRDREARSTAISLDVGRWIRPTVVPEDPDAVEKILRTVIIIP